VALLSKPSGKCCAVLLGKFTAQPSSKIAPSPAAHEPVLGDGSIKMTGYHAEAGTQRRRYRGHGGNRTQRDQRHDQGILDQALPGVIPAELLPCLFKQMQYILPRRMSYNAAYNCF
jgi:hypothetical protein